MLDTLTPTYTARFDENSQELSLIGSMRPQHEADMAKCLQVLEQSLRLVRGTLYINVKRLVRVNNIAFRILAAALVNAATERPDLKIKIITSSVVGWSTKKFGVLSAVNANLIIEEYDNEFYPGQTFVENSDFIHVLRTQTKMTWRHERSILPRHGLKPGMKVADICSGIGDFAVLMQKEFNPSRIVALDHSKSSLAYARGVAEEFGISGIEYVYGDASEMLLEDNQFDFVTCRHALQVFDRPELILKELFRICKPGGRVYVTNEKNSHCLGEPHGESIQWTYTEVAKLWHHFNMDIECGPKSRRLLQDSGFDKIQMESFMVTNLDGDPQDFADIIESWKNLFAGDMAKQRGDSPEFIERFKRGFDDHIFAALHPKGYAGWPIWVASGRKPL
ncbi:SAM-dependent methyltransferase [Metarhizobium album]|uniref:SAM-dependent methyltransferase n=1 Tax=Metarhizobium album TaxID=2182425 RepID=A0A2U2DQS6_9HYPH|nr:class I SAM-dependent methyltransferase [Rhizobium album]PWE55657.1 SAM-dependent methyltransferase [Rhizobium album]